MRTNEKQHRAILQNIARQAMRERGLLPDFSDAVLADLDRLQPASGVNDGSIRDLTDLLWASIDNDDSQDLDQLTFAESLPGDKTRILVAVADVDALVADGSAIDVQARHNTTSVYTAAQIFPMLPEKLSTDLTSLNFAEYRLAVVVEMVIGPDGSLLSSDIYRARVRNRAKLAYNSVAPWLAGEGPLPAEAAAVKGLAENLRIQDRAAQRLKNLRHLQGALSLDTIEARPIFDGDQISELALEEKNRAKEIIEDFMIAGGAILFCIAILDLVAHNKVERRAASELAAVPIGTPLMVGPAVLTTSLISIDQYGIAITMIAVLVNIFIAGATFVFSDLLIRLIGKAGANALSKVFSLFLAAIAVMMMRRGILKIISSHFLPGII